MGTIYITTEDNPWNPFTNWDEWLSFDIQNHYYTCEKLARLTHYSETLPDTINTESILSAIDELISIGAINKNGKFVKYKKVTKEN